MDAKQLATTVEVDRERTFVIDFNVLCDAEKICDINFLLGMNLPMSFHGMRAICFVSWKKEDPTLTLEQTGNILQDHWPIVMEKLTETWLKMMPDAEGGESKTDSDPIQATVLPPS